MRAAADHRQADTPTPTPDPQPKPPGRSHAAAAGGGAQLYKKCNLNAPPPTAAARICVCVCVCLLLVDCFLSGLFATAAGARLLVGVLLAVCGQRRRRRLLLWLAAAAVGAGGGGCLGWRLVSRLRRARSLPLARGRLAARCRRRPLVACPLPLRSLSARNVASLVAWWPPPVNGSRPCLAGNT